MSSYRTSSQPAQGSGTAWPTLDSWSPAAASVWAKTNPAGDTWLPLVTHMTDAGGVAEALFDHFLPRSIRSFLAEQMNMSVDQARSMVAFLAAVHDCGKVSPSFAVKASMIQPELVSRMRDAGFDFPHTTLENVWHSVAGQVFMQEWLEDQHVAPRDAIRIACVIGGHHGKHPDSDALKHARNHPNSLGGDLWREARTEMLDKIAQATGVDAMLKQKPPCLPVAAQILITGVVIMADWIASNEDLFPHQDHSPTRQRVARGLEHLHLPQPWAPTPADCSANDRLSRRFNLPGFQARPLQQAAFDLAQKCPAPGLFIFEAEPGNGKTEAAFLAAEELAARFGLGGVFIGLPTMATADPMFDRTLDWLGHTLGQAASVSLAHSKAALNDSYSGLMAASWRGSVWEESDEAAQATSAQVNSWLSGRKKAGLASFVVGTIDQALFAGLKAKHVVLRHLGLAGKVVVIDEVHAADDYMREYLKVVLTWLAAFHTPVILLSATLPPEQRIDLVAAYARGQGAKKAPVLEPSKSYPQITAYTGTVETVDVEPSDEWSVSVSYLPDSLDALVDRLTERLVDGGCAGVICDTVSRAQETYRRLQESFGEDVLLLHSRFIATDRAQRAAGVVAELGRSAKNRPHRRIVVGTQVLEQSLDIDFDILISDIAPIDLILQRLGRLYRHDRTRPRALATPELLLRGVEDWHDPQGPRPVRGAASVYGASKLMRAMAVLGGRGTLILPTDVPLLVRDGYDPDLPPPDGWEERWASAEDQAGKRRAGAVGRARAFLLDESWEKTDTRGLVDVDAGDPESASSQGRSQVRDSDEGLEVIALFRDDQGILHTPHQRPEPAAGRFPRDSSGMPRMRVLPGRWRHARFPYPSNSPIPDG